MLGRSAILVPKSAAQCALIQPNRGMANLKIIAMRLKSVKNIQKITQSMKMVSAAKYARAERDLKAARPYGDGAQSFYKGAGVGEKPVEAATAGAAPKELFVALSSDRGLCGGIHSNICKTIRNELQARDNIDNVGIICVGDKSRAQLGRLFGKNILAVGSEIGRLPPQFGDASKIASAILNSGFEFDKGHLLYNEFKTVVSYSTKELPLHSMVAIKGAPKIDLYDSIDDDVLQSYLEYSLASLLYYCLKEGACSEQSSRMSAMDNATRNANDMFDALELKYNKARQAAITTELIEIISGAESLKG